MSTALLAVTPYLCILTGAGLAALGYVNSRQRKRIAQLLEGQRRWRDIAIYHDKAKKAAEAEAESVRGRFKECGEIIDIWEERFKRLVVFIWGAPAIDRTLQNVLDYIGELRAAYELKEKSNEGLAEIVRRHNAELKLLREKLNELDAAKRALEQEAQDYAAMMGTLIEKGWIVSRHQGTGRFLILAVDNGVHGALRTVAGGDTIEDALREALGQIPAATAE